MEEPRQRIFGRGQVQVDSRADRIRPAAGSIGTGGGGGGGGGTIHINVNRKVSAWSAFIPAFGQIMNAALSIHNDRNNEAERLRRKAEADEEARLQQLQALEADRWALDVQNRLGRAIDDGTLRSTEDMAEWLRRDTEGLDHARDAAFIQTARAKLSGVVANGQTVLAAKARKAVDDNLVATAGDTLGQAMMNHNYASPEGRAEVDDVFSKVTQAYLAAGRTEAEAQATYKTVGLRVAGEVVLDNPERAWSILDRVAATPGGYLEAESLRNALEERLIAHDEREEVRVAQEEEKLQRDNFNGVIAGITQAADAEALASYKTDLMADPAALRENLGDVNFVTLGEMIARQEAQFMQRDAVAQARDARDSSVRMQREMLRLTRGEELTLADLDAMRSTTPGDGGLLPADWQNLYAARGSAQNVRKQETWALAAGVLSDEWPRIIQDGRLQGLEQLSDLQIKEYVGQAVDAAVLVDRTQFPEGAAGDAQFRSAQAGAIHAKYKEIAAGAEGTRYKSPFDTSANATSTPPKPEFATYADLQENPSLAEDIERRLFIGRDSITAGRASPSGRPHVVTINRRLYDSLADQQVKKWAADLIVKRGIEERAKRTAEVWWGLAATDDERDEQVWRRRQINQARMAGDMQRVRGLWGLFNTLDGGGTPDEASLGLIAKPEIEGE